VHARHEGGAVAVRLDVPATSGAEVAAMLRTALGEAADRVAALGGTLSVTTGGCGVEVTAVIPCGS
jgi:signal transduction histidine kinase